MYPDLPEGMATQNPKCTSKFIKLNLSLLVDAMLINRFSPTALHLPHMKEKNSFYSPSRIINTDERCIFIICI